MHNMSNESTRIEILYDSIRNNRVNIDGIPTVLSFHANAFPYFLKENWTSLNGNDVEWVYDQLGD